MKLLESVESLSEETIRWNPTEEEWSILQIISHLDEAVPYWLVKWERVVQCRVLKWGRGLARCDRLAAVTDTEKLSGKQVIEKWLN